MENKKYPIEMKYTTELTCEILDKGRIKGYFYYIVSYGTHPCCYVEIDEKHPYYKKHYDKMDIKCHGGLTYSEMTAKFCGKPHFYIGWDYAHVGDYNACIPTIKGKQWTCLEMFADILDVISQLQRLEHRTIK